MPTIQIRISCDNAAFVENPHELTNILQHFARNPSLIDIWNNDQTVSPDFLDLDEKKIRDSNGNFVGTISIYE